MGAQLTPEGVKFNGYDDVQTKPVNSVNGVRPNSKGEIEVAAGGGATYTSQDYHASSDFLFKNSEWYGGHVVYSYSNNASAIENLSVGSVLHEVGSGLPLSVVSIDADANRITLNRGDFVDLGTSNRVLEDSENATFSGTTFTYVSGAGDSLNCTNIWLQVKGNENHANTTTLPTTNNSVANLPMKLDHLPSSATHIIFRVSSETGGSFKIYNRETFDTRPATAELLPSEIVHQVDIEGSGTQSGFSEFRVPINSYFRFWVTGGAKANLYPVGYSVLDLSEIDLESASNPVIDDLQNQITSNDTDITNLQNQTNTNTNNINNLGPLINNIQNDIPTDLNDLSDDDGLLSSGGGGEFSNHVRFFSSNPSWTKPNGVNFILAIVISGGNSTGSNSTITIPNTSFHRKLTNNSTIGNYDNEYTEYSDLIGKSFTFQYLKEDLNLIQNWVFTETVSGVNNSGVTLTPSSSTGTKHGFVGARSPLNSTWVGGHSLTYGRDGVWLGGGEGSIGSPGRNPGNGGTLNGLATLGGANPGQFGGAGGFAGGGAGYTWNSNYITDHNREGGSGFGAGGGGGAHNSGEYDVYFIIVPSTQSSWNIVVGAGGTAASHMSGGGSGGQGAVFLYY